MPLGIDPILLLNDAIPRARIRTRYGPDIVLEHPFGPEPGALDAPEAWLKPAIDITLADGTVKTFAPWGDPGATEWPTVKTIACVGGGLLALFAGAWLLGGRDA